MQCLFAYDLTGFQTEADLNHFTRYALTEGGAEALGDGRLRAGERTLQAGACADSLWCFVPACQSDKLCGGRAYTRFWQ